MIFATVVKGRAESKVHLGKTENVCTIAFSAAGGDGTGRLA